MATELRPHLPSDADAGTVPAGPADLTVVIFAFRRRSFVEGAVRSVLSQRSAGAAVEVVVVTDFTDERLDAAYRSEGVVVLHPSDVRQGAWVVEALRHSKGDVVVFLDDDDRFLPGKLRWVAEVFSRDLGVAYYHNSITRFSGSHEPNELSALPREPTADTTTVYSVGRLQAEPSLVRQIWDSGAAFNASSIAVRRAMLDAHLDDLRAVRGGVGAFLFFAALSTYSGNIVLDAERWTLYRRHESNTSTASAGGPPAQWARDVSQAPTIVDDAEVILRTARRSGLLGPAHLFPVLLRQRRYSFWKAIGWPRSQRALVWAAFEGYLRVARGDSRGNALVLVVLGIISLVSPAIGRTLVTPGKAPNGG